MNPVDEHPREARLDDLHGVVSTREELIAIGPPQNRSKRAAGRRVVTPLAGQHSSRVHGAGMAFSEVRAYQPGDDIRSIDWRVTARTGQVHSKLFEAERERPVWLSVDLGSSMQFATHGAFKSVAAARAASCMAWEAYAAGERVGAVISSPGVCVEIAAGRTRRHLMRILEALADGTATPYQNDADARAFAHSLGWIRTRARTGSRVVVVSDFYQLDESTLGILHSLARRCELVLVWIHDPLEVNAPPAGRYLVSDGQSHQPLVAKGSQRWRNAYAEAFRIREEKLREFSRNHRATLIPLRTDTPLEPASFDHGLGEVGGKP